MKLRNKKTGEHGDYQIISAGNLIRVREYESDESWQYDCLADFNDKWEDYEPVEPLIKDEKIRKAVQAWAKLNNIVSVVILDAKSHFIVRSLIGISYDLELNYDYKAGFKNIEFGKSYAIEELCGEEEE